MTARIDVKKYTFWRTNPEWYEGDLGLPSTLKMTPAAPPEAVESFKLWMEKFGKT